MFSKYRELGEPTNLQHIHSPIEQVVCCSLYMSTTQAVCTICLATKTKNACVHSTLNLAPKKLDYSAAFTVGGLQITSVNNDLKNQDVIL